MLVDNVKKIIKKQVINNSISMTGNPFSDCQKCYSWTNENIADSLEIYDVSNKDNALCVTSSGDHIFNLVTKGILEIDAFDINSLTEYFAFGLKMAIIRKYNFEEFNNIIRKLFDIEISLEELTTILYELLPFMDMKYQIFWSEVIEYNYKIQKEYSTNLNLLYLLCISTPSITNIYLNNNYLFNASNYELLKRNLNMAKLSFHNVNAKDLGEKFAIERYDVIMLSNILDYFVTYWSYGWHSGNLAEYILTLKNISKSDALIYLKYIMLYKTQTYTKNILFEGSSVCKQDLGGLEIHQIDRNYQGLCYDGVILKRLK